MTIGMTVIVINSITGRMSIYSASDFIRSGAIVRFTDIYYEVIAEISHLACMYSHYLQAVPLTKL